MEKSLTSYFTPEQQVFLTLFRENQTLLKSFYLTGGTALSACYFNHRLSEDIDLFTRKPFSQTSVTAMMAAIAKTMKAKLSFRTVDTSLRYDLVLPHSRKLKIDFVHYEFDHLEKPNMLDGLMVDSIEDIATNKLLTISQRTASKDYVDLYFILKNYTLWDLRRGVEHKFRMDIESLYLASLLKQVDTLETMPIMKKNLSLDTLKKLFRQQAVLLATPLVKP